MPSSQPEDPPNSGIEPQCLQSLSSVAQSCLTLCDPMDCIKPGFPVITNFWSLLKIMSIKSLMPSNHLILCRPLLLLLLIFPRIRVFSNESVLCIKWPKYSSFSFKISPSNEYSRLISFRIDWFLLCFLNLQMSSLMLPEKSHFALYFIITTL